MVIAFLAAALLAQPPESGSFTARQMYEGCRLMAARPAGSPAPDSRPVAEQVAEMTCAASIAVELAVHAVNEAVGDAEARKRQSFCPPASVLDADDSSTALARAYVAWFERHPAAQDMTDGDAALRRALAETWPCPR